MVICGGWLGYERVVGGVVFLFLFLVFFVGGLKIGFESFESFISILIPYICSILIFEVFFLTLFELGVFFEGGDFFRKCIPVI